jgi:thioredoxin-like negative regulator of GroEL
MDYRQKYLKYKTKYFELKNKKQTGGAKTEPKREIFLFKAEWCGYCKGFKDTWAQLKKDLSQKYIFTEIDADVNKKEIQDWKISGFPTIMSKEGSAVEEYVGARDYESVRQFIEK